VPRFGGRIKPGAPAGTSIFRPKVLRLDLRTRRLPIAARHRSSGWAWVFDNAADRLAVEPLMKRD
jgi:hypothetical protein